MSERRREDSGPATPFVGREDQLNAVLSALRASRADGPSIVLVRGEAGVGKSSLAQVAMASGFATVVLGHCGLEMSGLAYAPIVEALGRVIAAGPLPELPEAHVAELARVLPELQAAGASPAPEPVVDPDLRRQRLVRAVAALLAALPGPTLLAIEDVHWVDAATRTMLAALAREPSLSGVGILLTMRTGEVPAGTHRLLAELRQTGLLVRVDLDRLSASATGELVARLTGRDDPALGQRVYAETGGNPLYVLHLLHAMADDQADAVLGSHVPVPAAIRELVAARLGQLGPVAGAFAAALAICRRGSTFDDVLRVSDLAAAPSLDALDALLAADVLREQGRALVFSHDLVRRAVEAAMSATRRRHLHARAYDLVVESLGGAEPDGQTAGILAHHASQAELWEPTLRWSRAAAEAADAVFAGVEAAEHWQRALAALGRLPTTPERGRLGVEMRLRLARYTVALPMRLVDSVLAEADTTAQGLDDEALRLRVLAARVTHLWIRGRCREAKPPGERLLEIARASGNRFLLANALRAVGNIISMQGSLVPAIDLLYEATAIGQELGDNELLLGSVSTNAIMHATLGEPARAEPILGLMRAGIEPIGSPALTGYLHGMIARVRLASWRWAEAVTEAAHGLNLARVSSNQTVETVCVFSLGPALLEQGDIPGAIAALIDCISVMEQADTITLLDRTYTYLAEAHRRGGDLDSADDALGIARRIAEEQGFRYGLGLCSRGQGLLAATRGDARLARALVLDARRRFVEIGARYEILRCEQILADVAADPAERAAFEAAAQQLGGELSLPDQSAPPQHSESTVGG